MGVYENLLPGKENALTPEYLTVKCHFSSVRMLQKQIEAERNIIFDVQHDEAEKFVCHSLCTCPHCGSSDHVEIY